MTEAKIPNGVDDLRRLLTERLARKDALDIRNTLSALCCELKSIDTRIDYLDGDKMEIRATRPKSYTGQGTIGADVQNMLAQLGVASDITSSWSDKYGHPIHESSIVVFRPSDLVAAILPVTRAQTLEAKKAALQAIWDAMDKGADAMPRAGYLADILNPTASPPETNIFPR